MKMASALATFRLWLRARLWRELFPEAAEHANGLLHDGYARSLAWGRTPMDAKFVLQVAEYALWITGVGCLLACLGGYTAAAWYQSVERARFEALSQHGSLFIATSGRTRSDADEWASDRSSLWAFGKGLGPLGIIDIPRLGMSSIVEEGDDSGTLLVAIGHVPGTALPGDAGNVVLAGHRDTFFRKLNHLQPGDFVMFNSLAGPYRYRVESTRVVEPSDKEVLNASTRPTLTLITCFPFEFVGAAPKRFVVTAREEDTVGAAAVRQPGGHPGESAQAPISREK